MRPKIENGNQAFAALSPFCFYCPVKNANPVTNILLAALQKLRIYLTGYEYILAKQPVFTSLTRVQGLR